MSEVKVNKISPRTNCGTVQLGDSGDTITIPAGATITNNGTQTGFGRTGTVDWDTTPKTASFTAVSGTGYFVNTTSGAVTMTMPSGSAGAIVSIQDYNKTFDTNALTVTPASGEKINGGSADGSLIISIEGQGLTFVYVDATVGWKTVHENEFTQGGSNFITATGGTVTCCGDYKIHTFTSPGTFTVCTTAACASDNIVSYMVVAGGGGTGGAVAGQSGSGGGGAGGFREYKGPADCYTASPLNGNPGGTAVTVTATAFPITVGGGGALGPQSGVGSNGSNSIFSTITSAGGGGGASKNLTSSSGGSGAGGVANPDSPASGNTPPTSPPQGQPGGPTGSTDNGGGGGGAGASGGSGSPTSGGNGATGVATSINGSPVTRAGGGGGGAQFGGGGSGGSGGGGAGGADVNGTPGTVNTGGGAGGAGSGPGQPAVCGANGGSGIVIIRYKYQ